MKRLALIVTLLAPSTALAWIENVEDFVWTTASNLSLASKPADIAELVTERFELGAGGIVATTVETTRFDERGRSVHWEQRAKPGAPADAVDWTFDANDRVVTSHRVDVTQTAIDTTITYELDPSGRILAERHASAGRAYRLDYTWAADGSHTVGNVTWDASNRLVSDGRTDVRYDAHGYPERIGTHRWNNVYDRNGRLTLSSDGVLVRLYFWNSRGDLAEVAEKRGGLIVAKTVYTYFYR